MAGLEWTTDLQLGVAAMDAEHRGLVNQMNTIADLAARRAPKVTLDAAITQLVTLTKRHFADEEVHMERIRFPDLARHKFIHQELLKKVSAHHDAFRAGSGAVDDKFLQFLVYWLTAHIKGIDRQYAVHEGTGAAR